MTDSNLDTTGTERRTDFSSNGGSVQKSNTQTYVIFVIVALVFIVGAVYFFNRTAAPKYPPVPLTELGVAIHPDPALGFSYVAERVSGVGNVLFATTAATEASKATTTPCFLGGYFMVDKASLDNDGAGITKDTLQDAIDSPGDVQFRVKEFETFYLIFEPSATACSTDTARENSDREQLLDAVDTAIEV